MAKEYDGAGSEKKEILVFSVLRGYIHQAAGDRLGGPTSMKLVPVLSNHRKRTSTMFSSHSSPAISLAHLQPIKIDLLTSFGNGLRLHPEAYFTVTRQA